MNIDIDSKHMQGKSAAQKFIQKSYRKMNEKSLWRLFKLKSIINYFNALGFLVKDIYIYVNTAKNTGMPI